jgi:enolase
MIRLTRLFARELLDSRGRPTVEVEATAGGLTGRAIVPSGASTGKWEACELRDRDPSRYDGLGVRRAVANVNGILRPLLLETDVSDQAMVDQLLVAADGTSQKTALGGNALLGVSLAIAHLGAAARGVPLFQHFHSLYSELPPLADSPFLPPPPPRMPLPMTNMISGGLHAGGNIDFQDVLVMPIGASDYATGLEWIVRIYNRLGRLLAADGYEGRLVGDEGGFGPRLPGNREAVEYVVKAIEQAELRPVADVTIALDVAATHFWDGGGYRLVSERDSRLSSDQMIDRLEEWVDRYPITSIEDGLAEDDWEGWERLTRRLGHRVRLVGDDLFTTNVERLRMGIERRVANSVLIKINQIGTITETLRAMQLARSAGYTCVVSARSGETEDATIADLAVGAAGDLIKIGSIVRSERLAKYNQLLRIAESFPSFVPGAPS